MDFENKDKAQDEGLFDDVLGAPLVNEEIGPDESAVSSAGLIHPDDMELEMIMAEHRSEEAPEETPAEEETSEADVLPEETAEEGDPEAEVSQQFIKLAKQL